MFGIPVLLGLCVYFLLPTAFPLIDYPHDLNDSFGTKNISISRTVVTDTSSYDYLTLLSAPFDIDNPNPVEKGYVHDDSDGAGTTIFVLDSGFNLERFPDEQCLDQRRIDKYLIPRSYRAPPLSDAEKQAGNYLPPDNMDDVSTLQNSKQITGHGTFVAALAAGCETGVARKANLYLIKMIDVMMKEGLVEETFSGPTAQLQRLRHVASVIQGFVAGVSATRGKAILVMCAGNWREDNMRSQHGATWDNTKALMKVALERLDGLGVTIVMTAGNDGGTPRYIDQQFPQGIATADSPMILVGATNSKGRLSPFSTPGRRNIPVSLYAQGEGVSTYDLLQSGRKLKYGTSYAAPIVAGLAAYILGLPSNPCPYNPAPAVGGDSVGMCMKKYLTRTAFQRVDSKNLLSQDPSQYKYDIPPNILVVSNGATAETEEEEGDGPDADPSACWSDDTRAQCKIMNITEAWLGEE